MGDPNYHKSIECPNHSGNNITNRRQNNNNGKQRDRNERGRRGRHALRGVIQRRTPPRVPKVNKAARKRERDDEPSEVDDNDNDSDGWTPKRSFPPYRVNSVRASRSSFEPPQPFILESMGGRSS